MFITNNHASFHLWWKENLVKHQKVSKYCDHDCGCVCVKRPTLNQNELKMSTLRSQCPKRLFCSTCCFQFSSRFEKGCQMLQSPRRKKQVRQIHSHSPTFHFFCCCKIEIEKKINQHLLLRVILMLVVLSETHNSCFHRLIFVSWKILKDTVTKK